MAREMKDSGVEWVRKLPAGWSRNKVVRLFNIIGSGTTPKSIDESNFSGDINWIQSGDINGGYISGTKHNVSQDITKKYSALKVYRAPFIVIAMYGASIGNLSISKIDGCVNQACCVLCGSQLDFKYAFYAIHATRNYLIQKGNGGGQPNISQEVIRQLWLPIPTLKEQGCIINFLDRKCTEIDAIIEKTRLSIEEYKKLKQAIITQAVTKGIRGDRPMKGSGVEWIGEAPSHWVKTKVKWLLVERKDRSEFGNEEPLSMSQKYGLIPTRNMDMVPNMASSFVGAKLVQKQDLVFNKLKAHLGVFSVSNYDGLVSPDYAVYYSSGLADVKFLEYLFKTPQYITEFKKKSTGVAAGLTRLYTDGLYSIYCALPPLDEQLKIVNYLNSKTHAIDSILLKKEQCIAEIEAYKKSLIFEYVTGKKEVF